MMDTLDDPLVYRHLVLARKALVEHVSAEQLQRLRQQLDAGVEVDDDIKHLVIKDTLKQTVKKVMRWAGHGDVPIEGSNDGIPVGSVFAEVDARAERGDKDEGPLRYRGQQGVVVSHIIKNHIPGGPKDEAMPLHAQMLRHPGFEYAEDPDAEFVRASRDLQQTFKAFSDNKFALLDKSMRGGCTLVTLVLTPIMAIPRSTVGVELVCEFHQKTRLGYVDADKYDVISEIGEFPVEYPSDVGMALMLRTVDEVFGPSTMMPRP